MEAVAGLDIGSSHIVVAAAVSSSRTPADPFGGDLKFGYAGSMGIRRGWVNDVPSLGRSISEALKMAESVAGVKIQSVYLGIPGHTVEFEIKKSGNVIGKGRRVTHQDIERVKRLALVSDLPPGRRVIQVMPVEYTVDGAPALGEPSGLSCSRLDLQSIVITADNQLVENLVEAANGAGIRVLDYLPSSLAVGEVVIKKAQRQLGAALIDIGSSSTSIVFYNHGKPLGFEVLPLGSDHITSDLAICLRTTLEGAEEVKRKIGLGPDKPFQPEGTGEGGAVNTISVPRLSGSGFNEAPLETAVSIIEARVSEILDMVKLSLVRLSGGCDLPGGLTLTGGGSQLKGLDIFTSKYIGCQVDMRALNNAQGGASESVGETNTDLTVNVAGAAGLLKYFFKTGSVAKAGQHQPQDLWSKVRGIFRVSK
ncbi:MAG: cell division protein FtsA [Bacillota bacterium]